ncbi:excalibur calcium-binding domain-containing protein, partial [Cellulomonas septica]
ARAAAAKSSGQSGSGSSGGSAYFANCDAARAAGAAPLHLGDAGYRSGLDRDKDGVACE